MNLIEHYKGRDWKGSNHAHTQLFDRCKAGISIPATDQKDRGFWGSGDEVGLNYALRDAHNKCAQTKVGTVLNLTMYNCFFSLIDDLLSIKQSCSSGFSLVLVTLLIKKVRKFGPFYFRPDIKVNQLVTLASFIAKISRFAQRGKISFAPV